MRIGSAIGGLLRSLGHGTLAAAPTEPTLTVSNDGDGDAVTATVDGYPGATNTLYYRTLDDSTWTEGESRTGDGDIAQTGLDDATAYTFILISSTATGGNSLPSAPVQLFVTSGDEKVLYIQAILNLEEKDAELELLCTEVA